MGIPYRGGPAAGLDGPLEVNIRTVFEHKKARVRMSNRPITEAARITLILSESG